MPGGFVDPGESIIQGLERELKEEVNAELKVSDTNGQKVCQFLFSFANEYPYSGHTIHTTDAFFLCEVLSPEALRPADDAASMEWIPLDKLDPMQFGLHSIRKGISRLIALSSGLITFSE